MDRRIKFRQGLYFGIAMTLFFIFQDLLTQDNLETKKIIITIVSAIFGGALAGILFGWLMGLLVNSKLFMQDKKVDTEPGETILFETAANYFKGAEGVGGKLYLTNRRLVFRSHKLNIQHHELSIPLPGINKVDRYKILGFSNNGLAVTTTNNTVEKFVVQNPGQWLSQLTGKNGLQQLF